MQCYTILYTIEGYFLTFTKRERSYFYHGNPGQIFTNGVAVTNGPGLFAFPGGRVDVTETAFEGCLREFTEECGCQIAFDFTLYGNTIDELIGLTLTNLSEPCDVLSAQEYENDDYYALFIQFNADDFRQIELNITETTMENNANAAFEVRSGNFASYDAIFNIYPYCPLDNELYEAEVWHIRHQIDEIRALANDQETDWYFDMIVFLANVILDEDVPYIVE